MPPSVICSPGRPARVRPPRLVKVSCHSTHESLFKTQPRVNSQLGAFAHIESKQRSVRYAPELTEIPILRPQELSACNEYFQSERRGYPLDRAFTLTYDWDRRLP